MLTFLILTENFSGIFYSFNRFRPFFVQFIFSFVDYFIFCDQKCFFYLYYRAGQQNWNLHEWKSNQYFSTLNCFESLHMSCNIAAEETLPLTSSFTTQPNKHFKVFSIICICTQLRSATCNELLDMKLCVWSSVFKERCPSC